jgi:hypothetical protein
MFTIGQKVAVMYKGKVIGTDTIARTTKLKAVTADGDKYSMVTGEECPCDDPEPLFITQLTEDHIRELRRNKMIQKITFTKWDELSGDTLRRVAEVLEQGDKPCKEAYFAPAEQEGWKGDKP